MKKQIEDSLVFAPDVKCRMILGNKVDKNDQRQVSFEEAQMLAEEVGMGYTEVSALDNFNIKESFDELI